MYRQASSTVRFWLRASSLFDFGEGLLDRIEVG